MSIHKECVDALRAKYRALTGNKLVAGHAHEIVAAYFGYGTAAALRAEAKYPLTLLEEAEVLMPALAVMDQRIAELQGIPGDLPTVDELAAQISEFLFEAGHFSGKIWSNRNIGEEVSTYAYENPLTILDELSGEMATTNAYFDGFYIDEAEVSSNDEGLTVTLTGTAEGEQDQERAFSGDKINFTTSVTFDLVAGRVAYREPEFDTGGSVDDSYFDDDAA
ncbi:hypothetical protein B5K05_33330 [Rhizobium phaseoli]|uniref:hypothetical protein n=1 Tax=Rhizobium phaseoli TaxID=396 RepID=UPI000E0E0897|nr:hypothetical protein [Rhizobium phaseoli]RDJ00756.1 hypothetical protein B5K05_33330 [Rhizobium phaseoli]RDJ00956.1 hypothetical protein B5K04_31415 [Rhizobium phaseoli]